MNSTDATSQKTFKGWNVYEVLPNGWKLDNSCGSPLHGHEFCTNGISILNGGKKALVRCIRKETPYIQFVEPVKETQPISEVEQKQNYTFPAKTANVLARKKFEEHLLKEIMFDLMVCEIEGWDKTEYVRELKNLINSIDISTKRIKQKPVQASLF